MFSLNKNKKTNNFNSSFISNSYTVRKHRPDYKIVLFMSLLMLLGLIIMFAIGPQRANVLNNAYGSNYSNSYFFIKQLVSVGLSLVVFFVIAKIPYNFFAKHANLLMIIGLSACTLLALAGLFHWGIAQESLGATRWFNLGPLGTLQPAEILKFGLLIYLSVFLGSKMAKGAINDLHETLIPLAVIMAVVLLFVVVIQEDLGTGVSICSLVASMLFVGGINKKNGLMILGIALALGAMLILIAPHRIDRVLTFLKGDNTSTSDDSSYQVEHAKIAIGTGGLFGVGIGNSVQATGYLPEAINDSVFAIMGETFGYVGLLVVLLIFSGLLMRMLVTIDHLTNDRLKLLVAGVFGWFGAHVILNIASMIGIFPLTGITLPLLSFGGTSMIFITAALGLVFQLSHYTEHTIITDREERNENSSSRRGVGRTRHTSSGGTKIGSR